MFKNPLLHYYLLDQGLKRLISFVDEILIVKSVKVFFGSEFW